MNLREAKEARMRLALRCVVGVVSVVMATTAASAQETGRLRGVVRDVAGAPMRAVVVTLTRSVGAGPLTVRTDESGQYVLDQIPSGRYIVTAEFGGTAARINDVEVGGPD